MIIHFDPANVSCNTIEKFLYEYVERELDARLLMAIDNHVLGCDKCRHQIDSYELTVRTGRYHIYESISLPGHFHDDLIKNIKGLEG